MELEQIPRLGPARARKMREAGIPDAKTLASIDLRRLGEIDGVSRDALKKHKADARKLLQANGISYKKAPYSTDGASAKAPAKVKKAAAQPATAPPATSNGSTGQAQPKRGLWARILRR